MSYSKKTDRTGEMITDAGLLFIEPANRPSETPVMDDLTAKMAEALRQPKETGVLGRDGSFLEGFATRGQHFCRCGAPSANFDLMLANGMITNSLATHYLAWHRDEVPAEQLELVRQLPEAATAASVEDTEPPTR